MVVIHGICIDQQILNWRNHVQELENGNRIMSRIQYHMLSGYCAESLLVLHWLMLVQRKRDLPDMHVMMHDMIHPWIHGWGCMCSWGGEFSKQLQASGRTIR